MKNRKKILVVLKDGKYVDAVLLANQLSKQGNAVSLATSQAQAQNWTSHKSPNYFSETKTV